MRLVRTLRGRLVVIALVWCGLFLFATGFSLQTMMRNYWQEAEADGLRLQLYDLLSRLEIQPDGLPIVTEVMTPTDVALVAEYADLLQIGPSCYFGSNAPSDKTAAKPIFS